MERRRALPHPRCHGWPSLALPYCTLEAVRQQGQSSQACTPPHIQPIRHVAYAVCSLFQQPHPQTRGRALLFGGTTSWAERACSWQLHAASSRHAASSAPTLCACRGHHPGVKNMETTRPDAGMQHGHTCQPCPRAAHLPVSGDKSLTHDPPPVTPLLPLAQAADGMLEGSSQQPTHPSRAVRVAVNRASWMGKMETLLFR